VTSHFLYRRREFITLIGGAALSPLAARAQQPERMRRIGVLMPTANDAEGQARIAAFQRGLAELGWIDGRNVRIDYRWSSADSERMRAFATDLVALAPDVILANGSTPVAALRGATSRIPIVFTQVADPVGSGLVENLARPGANITGFTNFEYAMAGKWLGALKEIAPRVTRVGVLSSPQNPNWRPFMRATETLSAVSGLALSMAPARDAGEIERALAALAGEPDTGLIVLPDPVTGVNREQIVALAAHHRLPAAYPFRFFTVAGGLLSYGIDPAAQFREAASYVDRILRGMRPGDLPVQAPTKFELVINLKTAKALGLTVPPTLLSVADEVIE
jgi:putative ABC transport system substrate-binding protein